MLLAHIMESPELVLATVSLRVRDSNDAIYSHLLEVLLVG